MNVALVESVRQKAQHHRRSSARSSTRTARPWSTPPQTDSRCLSRRRPALFHGQWRIELRCRSRRRGVSASDHGGPAGADGHRPHLRPHHDNGRRQRRRLRSRVRAADHRPGATGRRPHRHFDQRQFGQSREGLSQGEGDGAQDHRAFRQHRRRNVARSASITALSSRPTAFTASRNATSPSITSSGTWCIRCWPMTAAICRYAPRSSKEQAA